MAPFDVVLDPGGDIVQPDVVYIDDTDRRPRLVHGRPSSVSPVRPSGLVIDLDEIFSA